MATAFARDYHMRGEIAATRDGRITALRVRVLADHGAFNATAQPSRFPAGFFHTFTGSYDVPAAHCRVTGVHTNKAPGGVAYACSFRVTEASYLVERLVDVLAFDLGLDPAELRMRNLLRPEQFPYRCATGWEYDSGDYPRTLALALEMVGYEDLRKEQAARRDGLLLGIGISFFTEAVGAGPRALMDIAGLGMADGAQLRVHPSGSAVLAVSCRSRSTPVSGAATVVAARKVRERARLVAAAMLEVAPQDLEWVAGRFQVRGVPGTGASFREIAMAAHSDLELPDGVEGHLDAMAVYNPPNLTFPCGAYVCVVEVDRGTGQVAVRRFVAVDDCGVRINPTIVEGQIHGGLADGVGMALMELIAFDEAGNHLGASFMDYLLPTALECPAWELGETVTPSPHHPVGAKGVGESATVGSPAAVVNAVLDAIRVRHADMPLTPAQVWRACQGRPLRPDLAIGDGP
jgi:aerobic carbon-monoxide dehydrogenase large subunit